MNKATKNRLTREQIMTPFTLTCAKCGGEATAYPYPLPKGTVFCPTCSPAWVKSYLEFSIKAHA